MCQLISTIYDDFEFSFVCSCRSWTKQHQMAGKRFVVSLLHSCKSAPSSINICGFIYHNFLEHFSFQLRISVGNITSFVPLWLSARPRTGFIRKRLISVHITHQRCKGPYRNSQNILNVNHNSLNENKNDVSGQKTTIQLPFLPFRTLQGSMLPSSKSQGKNLFETDRGHSSNC